MRIRIIKSVDGNWYKVGEEYQINPDNPYENIGCRVFREGQALGAKYPDVVSKGDYEVI